MVDVVAFGVARGPSLLPVAEMDAATKLVYSWFS